MLRTPTRLDFLRLQIAQQIELIAELICENRSALQAVKDLWALERQLIEEELRRR